MEVLQGDVRSFIKASSITDSTKNHYVLASRSRGKLFKSMRAWMFNMSWGRKAAAEVAS